VIEVLLLIVLGVLVIVVLLLPLWIGRRKRQLSSRLAQYQDITEALLEGDLAQAREALKALIRTDTEDVAAYLRLAKILRREGDLERSVAVYRSLRARNVAEKGLRQRILAGLAEDLFRLGRYPEAREIAGELRQIDRKDPLIWQVEAHEALEREDWPAASKAAEALTRSGRGYPGPKASQLRTHIAAQRAAAGQLREGRKLLEELLRDDPECAPALLLLGDLRTRQGDHEKAAEAWTRLLRSRADAAPQVVGRLEKAYFEMGRFSDLSALYEELASSSTGNTGALRLARARMAYRRGEVDEALRLVDDLLEKMPENRPARDWRLFLQLERGGSAEARSYLKDAVEEALDVPQPPTCPHCGRPSAAAAVRCGNCRRWLPDPFTPAPRRGQTGT